MSEITSRIEVAEALLEYKKEQYVAALQGLEDSGKLLAEVKKYMGIYDGKRVDQLQANTLYNKFSKKAAELEQGIIDLQKEITQLKQDEETDETASVIAKWLEYPL